MIPFFRLIYVLLKCILMLFYPLGVPRSNTEIMGRCDQCQTMLDTDTDKLSSPFQVLRMKITNFSYS